MKVYTRTGDQGKTSLVGGRRVSKGEDRIELYGNVDELNGHIGFLLSLIEERKEWVLARKQLFFVQDQLFFLGSLLACDPNDRAKLKLSPLAPGLVAGLEEQIDQMDQALPMLKNFILPRGTQAVAYAHICRSFARKVERDLVRFQDHGEDSAVTEGIIFINRLSDYFFTLARYLNFVENGNEDIWKP